MLTQHRLFALAPPVLYYHGAEESQDTGAIQRAPTKSDSHSASVNMFSKTEEEARIFSPAMPLVSTVPFGVSGRKVDGQGGRGPQDAARAGAVADGEGLLELHKTATVVATNICAFSPSASYSENPQARSAVVPSLPPFFKSAAASGGSAPVVWPGQRATGEAGTAQEVGATTQIAGVGFAGTPDAVTGCKCIIM